MKADPKVRAGGRCAQCGKPRRPERSRRYGGPQAELDPWCSSACARAYYGTSLPKVESRKAQKG